MTALCASRLELAAVRATHQSQSLKIAEGGEEKVEKRDDEASARIAEDDGDFHSCADLYARAAGLPLALSKSELDAVCKHAHEMEASKSSEIGQLHRGCDNLLPMWRQADLLVAAANCHRRAMSNIDAADAAADDALRLFPRHTDALHAKGASFNFHDVLPRLSSI